MLGMHMHMWALQFMEGCDSASSGRQAVTTVTMHPQALTVVACKRSCSVAPCLGVRRQAGTAGGPPQ